MEEETISIQIPEGAEADDELSFQVGGQVLTIPVPLHSQPGDVLQIKLGGGVTKESLDIPRDDDMDVENDDITVHLMTGNQLRIAAAADSPTSASGPSSSSSFSIITADGTFRCLWPASKFAIEFMNTSSEFRHLIQNGAPIRSVLELGAGQGLFGMAFADIVWFHSKSDGDMQVTLTDMEDAMGPLRDNVKHNKAVFQGRSIQFSTLPLTWHSAPTTSGGCSLDYILGSDLLYNIHNIPNLVSTIRRLISKTTKVLLSVRWRKPVEERSFFVALSDVLEWEMLHGACHLGYLWYGNPASDDSNKFFQQSMVGCNGQMLPLCRIDEAATAQMTTAEFESFEALQTQMYLGRVIESSTGGSTGHDSKRLKTM
jgi:predicted nicotinamide N-methyase